MGFEDIRSAHPKLTVFWESSAHETEDELSRMWHQERVMSPSARSSGRGIHSISGASRKGLPSVGKVSRCPPIVLRRSSFVLDFMRGGCGMRARFPRKSRTKDDETIWRLTSWTAGAGQGRPVMAYRKRVEVRVVDLISDPK